MAQQTTEQAIEEIGRLFRGTDALFKESRAQFRETDAKLAQVLAETQAEVARYAYRQGLYVLSITGDGLVQILNDDKFRPHDYASG